MFEDSLFESQTRAVSAQSQWTAAASIAAQAAVAALLVALPLFHTELLPGRVDEIKLVVPLPHVPPPPPRTVMQRASSALATATPVMTRVLMAPRIAPQRIDTSAAPESTAVAAFGPMGASTLPAGIVGASEGAVGRVVVAGGPERKAGPLRVSGGVSAGMLLTPIRPVYPPIARAAHAEGTVVVEAVISKAGAIESLHVLSGPAMLQTAALEAIRAARYQPFRLNGEPTEVQTTITVNFRMGG